MVSIGLVFTAARYGIKLFKYGYRTGKFVKGNRVARTLAKDGVISAGTGGIFGGAYTGFQFARDVYNDYKNISGAKPYYHGDQNIRRPYYKKVKDNSSRGSNSPIRGGIW